MIKKFKIFEKIEWYKDGEFIEDDSPEKTYSTDFKVGDHVKCHMVIFLDDYKSKDKIPEPRWDMKWKEGGSLRHGVIINVGIVEDLDGYTGQIIKLDGFWPWYQTTNMELK